VIRQADGDGQAKTGHAGCTAAYQVQVMSSPSLPGIGAGGQSPRRGRAMRSSDLHIIPHTRASLIDVAERGHQIAEKSTPH